MAAGAAGAAAEVADAAAAVANVAHAGTTPTRSVGIAEDVDTTQRTVQHQAATATT